MNKFACILLLSALAGCTAEQGTFTVISNKIVNVNQFDLNKATRIKNVVGDDKSQIIVFIPTKANTSLSGALNDAFRQSGGDVMTDATVTSYYWWIPYIYGEQGWRIEGDAIKTRNQ